MADVLCPKCNAKGNVKVRQATADKGGNLKYYECAKCKTLWTNLNDIKDLPVEA